MEAQISRLQAEIKSEQSLHIKTNERLWESDKDRDILVKMYVEEKKRRKKAEKVLEQLKQQIASEQNHYFKDKIDEHIDKEALQQQKRKLNEAWNR